MPDTTPAVQVTVMDHQVRHRDNRRWLTGYPGIPRHRKLLSDQEARTTYRHQDMPRCVSPTPPT